MPSSFLPIPFFLSSQALPYNLFCSRYSRFNLTFSFKNIANWTVSLTPFWGNAFSLIKPFFFPSNLTKRLKRKPKFTFPRLLGRSISRPISFRKTNFCLLTTSTWLSQECKKLIPLLLVFEEYLRELFPLPIEEESSSSSSSSSDSDDSDDKKKKKNPPVLLTDILITSYFLSFFDTETWNPIWESIVRLAIPIKFSFGKFHLIRKIRKRRPLFNIVSTPTTLTPFTRPRRLVRLNKNIPPFHFVKLIPLYKKLKKNFFTFFRKLRKFHKFYKSPLFRIFSLIKKTRKIKKTTPTPFWSIRKWKITKIRFKPGYQRQWRLGRRDLKVFLNFPVRYQHRLTWFINKLARNKDTKKYNSSKLGITLLYLLWRLKFAYDIISIQRFFKLNFFLVNGVYVKNPSFLLIPFDILTTTISFSFYSILFLKFRLKKGILNRWFKLANFSSFRPLYQIGKIWKPSSASNKFRQLIFFWTDVPPFFQMDWFSLSCFILTIPKHKDFFIFHSRWNVPYSILKIYNWKYIN
uniref:30S ribosomal protein S4 n=1 Tax=Bakuella subtropica TaxID=1295181 RepID=UPI0023F48CF0|nr:30S ribosomal protein S4 [Bakuella subtropica]WDY80878.1 30S ribosomal protein S4 [Bakuella subtropica]